MPTTILIASVHFSNAFGFIEKKENNMLCITYRNISIYYYIHNIVQNAPESEFIIDAMCFVLKDDALCVLWLILDAALHTISGSMILKPWNKFYCAHVITHFRIRARIHRLIYDLVFKREKWFEKTLGTHIKIALFSHMDQAIIGTIGALIRNSLKNIFIFLW